MRTAKEMYQFCLDHDYGQGFNTHNSIKHFEIIEKNLLNDEEVLFVFIGLHNYISATKHDNNFAYAITSKRIVMGQKRVIGEAFQTVALNKVNDITLQTGVVFGVLTIDAQTEKFNVAVTKAQAQNINAELHSLLLELRNKSNNQNTSVSSADEIRKYKALLDDGIITEEEFEKKKAQLLA